jgi:hypothetical protein
MGNHDAQDANPVNKPLKFNEADRTRLPTIAPTLSTRLADNAIAQEYWKT